MTPDDPQGEDYLWAGKGDDAGVQELEALLAPMKHQQALRARWPHPWRSAALIAVTASILFFFLLAPGRAPARLVGLFHDAPVTELSIYGGARVELLINEGRADRELSERTAVALVARGARFVFAGESQIVLELPEYGLAEARAWAFRIASKGDLTFQRVIEDNDFTREAYQLAESSDPKRLVEGDIDMWTSDATGGRLEDFVVTATDRTSLRAAYESWFASGELTLPEGTQLAFGEWQDGRVRSYLINSTAELDRSDIANTNIYWNPTSNRPELLIEFTVEGGERFATLTGATVGKKIAFVLDGEVNSAPTVQARIEGGSTSISMGGSDPNVMQAEAEALSAILRPSTELPADVTVTSIEEVAPSVSTFVIIATEALMAGLAGLCIFLLAWPLAVFSRSTSRVAVLRGGKRRVGQALGPLAVSVAGFLVVVVLSKVWLPGTEEFFAGLDVKDARSSSFASIGIMPFLIGAVVAEFIAWVIPSWRKRRGGNLAARSRIYQTGLFLGLGLLATHAFFISSWMAGLGENSMQSFSMHDDPINSNVILVSLIAGSCVLYAISRLISRYGLGNGVAVVVAAELVQVIPDFASNMREISWISSFSFFECFMIITATVLMTSFLMRRSVRLGAGLSLHLPGAGIAPLLVGPTLLSLVTFLSYYSDGVLEMLSHTAQLLSVLVFSTAITVFALRKPRAGTTRVVSGVADSINAKQLLLAASLSIAFPVALLFLIRSLAEQGIGAFIPLTTIVLGTAVATDLVGEFRARWRNPELVCVWELQRPRYLLPLVKALDHAGIDVFVQGRYFRILLSVLGPFVPMSIMVPEHRAKEARELIAGQI